MLIGIKNAVMLNASMVRPLGNHDDWYADRPLATPAEAARCNSLRARITDRNATLVIGADLFCENLPPGRRDNDQHRSGSVVVQRSS